jgi:tetratricopeptide (TPR) repeat protein
MKKNRSDLALAKFEEAEKYAPNWGRLHLIWGEALGYAGRKDQAAAQYQIASKLDLGATDKIELAYAASSQHLERLRRSAVRPKQSYRPPAAFVVPRDR